MQIAVEIGGFDLIEKLPMSIKMGPILRLKHLNQISRMQRRKLLDKVGL